MASIDYGVKHTTTFGLPCCQKTQGKETGSSVTRRVVAFILGGVFLALGATLLTVGLTVWSGTTLGWGAVSFGTALFVAALTASVVASFKRVAITTEAFDQLCEDFDKRCKDNEVEVCKAKRPKVKELFKVLQQPKAKQRMYLARELAAWTEKANSVDLKKKRLQVSQYICECFEKECDLRLQDSSIDTELPIAIGLLVLIDCELENSRALIENDVCTREVSLYSILDGFCDALTGSLIILHIRRLL